MHIKLGPGALSGFTLQILLLIAFKDHIELFDLP